MRRRTILLVAAWMTTACGSHPRAPHKTEPPQAAFTPKEERHEPACTAKARFVAVIASRSTANVTAQTEGVLRSVGVRLGDTVGEGDVIATIDERPLRAAVAAAAGVAAARAAEARVAAVRADHASVEAARQGRLARAGVGTTQAEDTAKSTHAEALASVEEAHAAVREANAHLSQATWSLEQAVVRAPVTGLVASRFVDPGNEIRRGEPLVRLVSSESPWIRFGMPANDVRSVRVGDAIAFESADGRKLAAGTVLRISPDVDPLSELVVAEATFTGAPDTELSPGIGGYVVSATPDEQKPSCRGPS